MQSICPAEISTFQTFVQQITKRELTRQNQVFKQIKDFLEQHSQGKLVQICDLSIQQCTDLQLLIEPFNSPICTELKLMLNTLLPILKSTPSSDFTITLADGEHVLHRMYKKPFETILENMRTTKKNQNDFITAIEDPLYNISLDQLKLLTTTYNYSTVNQKRIKAKHDYIESVMVKQPEPEMTTEEISTLLINYEKSIEQSNKVYKQLVLKRDTYQPITHTYELQQIADIYFNILNKCQSLQQYKGILDIDIMYAVINVIPMIIFKSFQILLIAGGRTDMKITECIAYIFQIPICYVSDDDLTALPLILTGSKPDHHLFVQTLSGEDVYMHKQLFLNQKDTRNIIHHINCNEFYNLRSNLIEIVITPEEKEFFGDKYNSFTKHMHIHDIFNSEMHDTCYPNCVNLQFFEANLSFYKIFIQKSINNPERMEYELYNTYYEPDQPDVKSIIDYMTKQIDKTL